MSSGFPMEFLWDLMVFAWHVPSSTQFAFCSVASRQLSKVNVIIGHNLINYARRGILGRLIDGTPQCNSLLEPKQEDLQVGMVRYEFQ